MINDGIFSNTVTLSSLYIDNKDEDGMLYIYYTTENTFGVSDYVTCPSSASKTKTDFFNDLDDDGCTITPDKYEVTIYEMGLCSSDPISNNTFNFEGA